MKALKRLGIVLAALVLVLVVVYASAAPW